MSAVRACVSDTSRSMRDKTVMAIQDHIAEQGWTPAEAAKVLSEAPETAESALRINIEATEAARDCMVAKGYTPTEIATNLPSVRREFVKRFMYGRELVSLDRSLSFLEALGFRARIVIERDESIAPRRRADATPATVRPRAHRPSAATNSRSIMAGPPVAEWPSMPCLVAAG